MTQPSTGIHATMAARILKYFCLFLSLSFFLGEGYACRLAHDSYDLTCLFAGLSFLFLYLGCLFCPKTKPAASNSSYNHWRIAPCVDLPALVILLALSAFMKLYLLADFPPPSGVGFEEAQTASVGYKMIEHGHRTYEFPITGVLPAISFSLFGVSLESLRYPFLLLGILSVIPFYLACRALYSLPLALFVSALFATSRWHALVSRFADELFTSIFLVCLVVWLYVKATASGNKSWHVLLGFFSGLLAYEYSSYRIVPFMVTFFIVLNVIESLTGLLREPEGEAVGFSQRASRRGSAFLCFLFSLWIPLTPVFISPWASDVFWESVERHQIMPRLEGKTQDRIDLPGAMEKTWEAFLQIFHSPSGPAYLNHPKKPLMEPVSGWLFALGFGLCALTFWRRMRLLLFSWVFLSLVIGAGFTGNFYMGRFAAILPIIYLMTGIPLELIRKATERLHLGRRLRIAVIALLLLLFGVDFSLNYHTFFHHHVREKQTLEAYDEPYIAMGNYFRRISAVRDIHTWFQEKDISFFYDVSDYKWIWPNPSGRPSCQPFDLLPPLGGLTQRPLELVFSQSLFKPEQLAMLADFYYPGLSTRLEPIPHAADHYQLHAIHLDPETMLSRRGLCGTYALIGSATAETMQRIDTHGISGCNPVEFAHDKPVNIHWQGLVYIPNSGDWKFALEGKGIGEIAINGEKVWEHGSSDSPPAANPKKLRRGWHAIRIALEQDAPHEAIFLKRSSAEKDFSIIPSRELFAATHLKGLRHVISIHQEGKTKFFIRRYEPSIYPMIASLFAQRADKEFIPFESFSEEWRGNLVIDHPGRWNFALKTWLGGASLTINDREIIRTESVEGDNMVNGAAFLATGSHSILVQFKSHVQSGVTLAERGSPGGCFLRLGFENEPMTPILPIHLAPLPETQSD